MLTGNLPFHSATRQETMDQILKAKLGMPDNLSREAQSLVRCYEIGNTCSFFSIKNSLTFNHLSFLFKLRALFKRVPNNRLGAGPNGIEDIKKHEFFATIDWDNLLLKKVRPPFIPAVSRDDAYYFDTEYTCKSPRDSPGGPVSASAREIFRGFSFIAPGLLDETESMIGIGSGSNTANANDNNMTNAMSGNTPQVPVSNSGSASNMNNGNPPLFPSRISPYTNEMPGLNPGAFQDEYQMGRELGRGTFSICRFCEHRATRKQYAVKIISKAERDSREEVEILLRYGNHPNIVTLYGVHEDFNYVYLVMDLLKGGELLDRILLLKRMSESEASAVLRTVTSALAYLHENGVVHRYVLFRACIIMKLDFHSLSSHFTET